MPDYTSTEQLALDRAEDFVLKALEQLLEEPEVNQEMVINVQYLMMTLHRIINLKYPRHKFYNGGCKADDSEV